MKTERQRLLLERIRNRELTPEQGYRLLAEAREQAPEPSTASRATALDESPQLAPLSSQSGKPPVQSLLQQIKSGALKPEEALRAMRGGTLPGALLTNPKRELPHPPIAVIGMSGRFPGAPTLADFWRNLLAGQIDLSEVPANRWRADDFYDPDPNQAGKSNSKWGGFLEQIDHFDPLFFALSPREAELMDPQQRLFLTETWRALEHAGMSPARLDKLACGVFAGCGPGDYLQSLQEHGLEPDALLFLGNSNPILAARISFMLNLRGPSLAIDTACSSSLVAVQLACESLASGCCELAIAGGVSVFSSPLTHLLAGKAGMLSPTGRCHTFDARADGFAPAEGVGVVVLKRLDLAERDGDPIQGVILASGINQDGRSNGITAPSATSQTALIRGIHKKFSIDPAQITLVEAHGTGTKLGDPIEVSALTDAFTNQNGKHCTLGSVKANIGHASTAAGIAGLLKTLLCLKHRTHVPLAGFSALNPHIDLANSPFVLRQEAAAWEAPSSGTRMAAVSSFGFSGTNAHLIVCEAPLSHSKKSAPGRSLAGSGLGGKNGEKPAQQPLQPCLEPASQTPQLLVLSARDLSALAARLADLSDWVGAHPEASLRDLAHTLLVGRSHFRLRLAFVAASLPQLRERLEHARALTAQALAALTDPAQADAQFPLESLDRAALTQRGKQALQLLQPAAPDETGSPGLTRETLELLAACYRKEVSLNWAALFPGARFLSLPTYPFQERRYWIPVDLQKTPLPCRFSAHPLLEHLHLADSTAHGLVFEKTLHPDHKLLCDHRVLGQLVLPGMAYLEMALAAARALAPDRCWRITDLGWNAPLTLSTAPLKLRLLLTSHDQGFAFQFQSNGTQHCQGLLRHGDAQPSARFELSEQLKNCPERLSSETLYAFFSERGLDYGPSFRAVRWLQVGKDQLVARLELPESAHPGQGLYWIHPALADAALQASVWLLNGDESPIPGLLLPFALADAHFQLPFNFSGYVCARRSAPHTLEFVLLNDSGERCARFKGLAVRPLPRNNALSPQASLVGPKQSQPLFAEQALHTFAVDAPVEPELEAFLSAFSGLEAWAHHKLWLALEAFIPLQPFSFDQFPSLLNAANKYVRTLGTLLQMLVESGWLSVRSDALFTRTHKPTTPPAELHAQLEALLKQAPKLRPFSRLIHDCCAQLPEIIRGTRDVTQVLFPTGSSDDVSGIYGGNLLADRFNQTVAQLAAAQIAKWLALQPERAPIRVLEIGGGTGATTQFVLEAFAPFHSQVNYLFSDISPAFIRQASNRFKHGFLHFQTFDLEREPLQQGLQPGFDLILASNVVHATKNIQHSLKNLHALLKPDGVLILNEITGRTAFGSLTFGLTDGWWCFEDGYRRIPGAPLLAPSDWHDALTEVGFQSPADYGKSLCKHRAIDHRIFLATGGAFSVASPSAPCPNTQAPACTAATSTQASAPQPFTEQNPPAPKPSARAEQDLAYVRRILAAVLKVPQSELAPDRFLEEFGVDSLVTQQIVSAFEPDFGKLPATLAFEHPTAALLASHLRQQHGAALDAVHARSTQPQSLFDESPMPPASVPGQFLKSARAESLAPQALTPTTNPPLTHDGPLEIAIIGIAGRYPQAEDLNQFWDNLRLGRDAIETVPPERWDWRLYHDDNPEIQGKTYSSVAGFLRGIDQFDARFFRISPREADGIDPQERLFLETAWHCVESAGYDPFRLSDKGRVGVFVGVMNANYAQLAAESWQVGSRLRAKTAYWSIANRVSFCLDYRGPSMAVDTACSSSLTALHLACHSILRGECEFAIAGGVNLILHPSHLVCLSDMHMLSPSGHCHAFGEAADGFTDGEGVGAVLLKPLAQALADGDSILAVIQGSATNCGGRTNGYTVPSPEAQSRAVADALRQAKLPPAAIGYIEAHGTGTALGDPIEAVGLRRALEQAASAYASANGTETEQTHRPILGSVKANIGHLESAAGIAGLSKILLQLQHKRLVPSLHSSRLNPKLDADWLNIIQEEAPWPEPVVQTPAGPRSFPRCAGLSSFGAGGSNVHILIQEAPAPAPRVPAAPGPQLFPFSARTPERLEALLRRHCAFLSAASNQQLLQDPHHCQDYAYTLQTGRTPLEHRISFLASSLAELKALLQAQLEGRPKPEQCFLPAPEIEQLLKGKTGEAFLASALQTREWEQLARLWVSGARLDWAQLWPTDSAKRLALPLYPFEPSRHWLSTPDNTARPTAQPTPEPAQTDSLLGAIDPGASLGEGIAFRLQLSASDPLLSEHQVNGQAILPGVASLILARQAWERLKPGQACQLADLRWHKPFRLDPSRQAHFRIRHDDEKGLRFELTDGETLFASGRYLNPLPSQTEEGNPIRARFDAWKTSGIYENLRAIGIQHGPFYQVIERYSVKAQAGFAELHAPSQSGQDWHPALLDGLLQSIGAVGELELLPMLPAGIGQVDFHQPPGPRAWAHAEKKGPHSFDLTLFNPSGALALKLHDFRVRPLADPLESLFYTPHWERFSPTGLKPGSGNEADSHHQQCGPLGRDPLLEPSSLGAPLALPCFHFRASETNDPALECFRFIRRLAEQQQDRPLRLLISCFQSCALFPDESIQPAAAALHGLALSASREFPNWRIELIDQDQPSAAPPEHPLPSIQESILAIRGKHAYVRKLVPVQLPAAASPYRQRGVYLILGGAGGIGLALAEDLISRFQARVFLIGRSELSAEKRQALRQIDPSLALLHYLRADATDAQALQAALAEAERLAGPLNGVFHAALVLRDRAIRTMDEASFLQALAPKREATQALITALADRTLDFLAFFSSAQSFLGNAGQANYAAGCTFIDAFAHKLAAERSYPVRILNWGYWGEVGSVATPAYRELLSAKGIQAISTQLGLAATERALAAPLTQVVPFKADSSFLARFGIDEETRFQARPASYPGLPARLGQGAPEPDPQRLHSFRQGMNEMDLAASQLFLAALFQLGIAQTNQFCPFHQQHPRIDTRHQRLFQASLQILADAQLVSSADGGIRWLGPPPAFNAEPLLTRHPDLSAYTQLLAAIAPRLAQILTGALPATDVLFPQGSSRLVSGIYKGHLLADGLNQSVASAASAFIQNCPAPAIRILEIGGGTGGTTETLLAQLARQAGKIRYDFSDISRTFVRDARQRFEAEYPFTRFKIMDISQPPSEALGAYDLVVAANVLHATPDLRQTIRHVAALLRPNGMLILNEVTGLSPFTTFSFGLLEGWWNYSDPLRMANTPLLDPSAWTALLREEGFGQVEVQGFAGLAQNLILARAGHLAGSWVPAKPVLEKKAIRQAPILEPQNRLKQIEALIVAAMAKTLEVEPGELQLDTPHSEFGLDSILGVEVITQLNRAGGWDLSPTDVFNYPTIRELAKYIESLPNTGSSSIGSSDFQPAFASVASKASSATTHDPDLFHDSDALQAPLAKAVETPAPPTAASERVLFALLKRFERGELSLEEMDRLLEDPT